MKVIETKIKSFGNSKGIIIPSRMIKRLGFLEDVIITEDSNGIRITNNSKDHAYLLKKKIEQLRKSKAEIFKTMNQEIRDMTKEEHDTLDNDLENFNDFDILEDNE
ncbi:AbrB/MazE/SpoVT family DNA-binding domain-containing protein [Flammeovirga kamogawensis]|uniref:AbrB/MazE/SpoVT family DNA-binding domain-containing protein n=1 Tax=Flammeovirga kamogawensis TaxID=373891 RepID=A0ABX8H4Y4_9BACT|nr:hypothetical protein [Flammeovirga kamogawensis]MBB6463849.1 antitoxin component of MazEF toxin-antitoxin module [Flammeovirga kamogawensis]QWG10774.1 hypothetical protein KM029_26810 [Flammeovirga kamogawensis]TRX63240.1 hypothetical protein EO216_26665 [Flammeovirga kamogawensis]